MNLLYAIKIERKAIGRNISLLKEAGIDIDTGRAGSYIVCRDFEDSKLRMLIDGVLSSKYITAKHSKDLIEKICQLSNEYFRSSIKHIRSVNDWSKTENQELFYNIEVIDSAIEQHKQIFYDYNKFGIDKQLHKSSEQQVSPYVMILHNQRYYLMAYSEQWHHIVFHRLDHITKMNISDKDATSLKTVPGYENGINYRKLSSTMPYMYADKPEKIVFIADASIIDQIIDWFGFDAGITKNTADDKVTVSIKSSPNAMEHWAMQYINHVEIVSPESLRNRIKDALEKGMDKYK